MVRTSTDCDESQGSTAGRRDDVSGNVLEPKDGEVARLPRMTRATDPGAMIKTPTNYDESQQSSTGQEESGSDRNLELKGGVDAELYKAAGVMNSLKGLCKGAYCRGFCSKGNLRVYGWKPWGAAQGRCHPG